MDAKFNHILNIIANSTIAYIVVLCLLKLNGFKINNNSRLRLSKVIKRLVINFLIYKLILIKFDAINFWVNYYSNFYFISAIYLISVIITVTKIVVSTKNKTLFNVLSIS